MLNDTFPRTSAFLKNTKIATFEWQATSNSRLQNYISRDHVINVIETPFSKSIKRKDGVFG